MSIYTILDRLEFLRGQPAALLVLAAAALAIAAWDMRLALLALGVHYLASFLLYVDVLDPRLAIVYTLTGVVVTLIMTITAAQVQWGRLPAGWSQAADGDREQGRTVGPFRLTTQRLMRLVSAIAILVAIVALDRAGLLPQPDDLLPAHVWLAVVGLVSLGLIGVATGGSLLGGVGLLIFLNGFDLLNSSVEQSIALVVALSAANLLVALVIAYLAQARFYPGDVPE